MYKFNALEWMMVSIVDYGEETIYNDIELLSNAIDRFQQRDLYFRALKKLKDKMKEEL